MLKKSASVEKVEVQAQVEAKMRTSDLRSTLTSTSQPASLAAALPAERRVLARRGWAGEKSGLFEHPARCAPDVPDGQVSRDRRDE